MITERQATILRIIVGEYIDTAVPVGSVSVARRHPLGVSPATIRNDMAELEEEGYILHPHPSAGRVPSDKGYRYYVESLMVETALGAQTQLTIRHQFHQMERDVEEWARLAASILAQMARNAAVVTAPRPPETRWKRLELISLQEFLTLLVLILQGAQVRQQLLSLEEPQSQEDLNLIATKLNAYFQGLTPREILGKTVALSTLESQICEACAHIMQTWEERSYDEIYLDGLRHILRQPEFAKSQKMQQMLEVLEERRFLSEIFTRWLAPGAVQVIIGQEHRQDAMRACSMVLTRYGEPPEASGFVAVLGPTRLSYDRVIPTVRYLGGLMTDLLAELYT